MNVVQPPPSQPGDDLDGLLRAFLRSQLPQPWPSPRWPDRRDAGPTVQRPANGWNLMRSRLALAASVSLLLLGSWLLPSRFSSESNPEHGPNGAAISNVPPDLPKAHKRQKAIENPNKPGLAADDGDQPPELEQSDMPMLR